MKLIKFLTAILALMIVSVSLKKKESQGESLLRSLQR